MNKRPNGTKDCKVYGCDRLRYKTPNMKYAEPECKEHRFEHLKWYKKQRRRVHDNSMA